MNAPLLCLVIMAYLLADSTTAQGSTFDIKCGVEEFKDDVISRMDTADEKLGNVEDTLDALQVQHNEHKKEMLTRMDAVDEKLDNLKQLLEQVIANTAPQWISIQRRGQYGNPANFFSKSMADYKTGFGTVDKEFWLGLDELARLTREGDWMMKVTMIDYDGKTYTGTYSMFHVGAGPRYELEVGGYDDNQSTLGRDVFSHLNTTAFSTKDVDQDTNSDDCSNMWGGTGWWFRNCGDINIIGQQTGNSKFEQKGMRAYLGKRGADVMLKESEMFIKKSPKM